MNAQLLFDFVVDKETNTITIKREFAADLALVWDAWTKAELLDQWWAPKPYQAKTISMNFTKGGMWFYYMLGPAGEKHYCKAYYQDIAVRDKFSYKDAFCNEQGEDNKEMPSMQITNTFTSQGEDSTIVHVVAKTESLEALETLIKMGMKEGFTMSLTNLDELLSQLKK